MSTPSPHPVRIADNELVAGWLRLGPRVFQRGAWFPLPFRSRPMRYGSPMLCLSAVVARGTADLGRDAHNSSACPREPFERARPVVGSRHVLGRRHLGERAIVRYCSGQQ